MFTFLYFLIIYNTNTCLRSVITSMSSFVCFKLNYVLTFITTGLNILILSIKLGKFKCIFFVNNQGFTLSTTLTNMWNLKRVKVLKERKFCFFGSPTVDWNCIINKMFFVLTSHIPPVITSQKENTPPKKCFKVLLFHLSVILPYV